MICLFLQPHCSLICFDWFLELIGFHISVNEIVIYSDVQIKTSELTLSSHQTWTIIVVKKGIFHQILLALNSDLMTEKIN